MVVKEAAGAFQPADRFSNTGEIEKVCGVCLSKVGDELMIRFTRMTCHGEAVNSADMGGIAVHEHVLETTACVLTAVMLGGAVKDVGDYSAAGLYLLVVENYWAFLTGGGGGGWGGWDGWRGWGTG